MNYSWITFADNDIYMKSAYALSLSLNQVQSKYPLCIMYPEGTVKIQQMCGNIVFKPVPLLYFNFFKDYWQNITINKFHCFACTEYEKVCFIDADSFFVKNMDYIFDLDTPAIGEYVNEKNEVCLSSGIFLIKPDLQFYSLLLNLFITMDFKDDENVFYFLSKENNYLKFNTYFNKDIKKNIIQEQKRIKFWGQFSYDQIREKVMTSGVSELLNYINL